MEIKDNTFARQFETLVDGKLISVEYSFQEKKIFLTRINTFDGFNDEELIKVFSSGEKIERTPRGAKPQPQSNNKKKKGKK